MPVVVRDKEDSESTSSSEEEQDKQPCIAWSGLSRTIPVLLFFPEAVVSKDENICCTGERYNMAFKIVRTESRLVRGLLAHHGFREVHPNSNDFNLMWTGSHLKPYILRSLQDFQKVNHFPRSYELTRKDRLYKNIQRMQQTHGIKNFHIVPQTFVLPTEYQEFCNCFAKDRGPWIIKPVASSRGRGIYLVSNPNQISMDENILVSRYINNPLLIDEFKFDVRMYVLVTSYDPLIIYVYEEGLARFATVKYDRTSKSIKNTFMHLTNYSVNKKSSDYVSCDDPEVEDYGNKWSMSAVLRYLRQEGKDTTLLMRQVEDVIVKALVSAELQIAAACKMFVPHKTNCFELYGFDVLIDSNLKPWLLEVNLSPSLACDTPLDLKIKASMIADMFSLVGFVCQDPLTKQPRSERVTQQDASLKHPAAAPRAQQQKAASASNPETEGSKDKQEARKVQGESTLGLTAEEIKVLRRTKEEYERRGGFIRIFPTAETWALYSGYLESKTSMNFMLASRLFHGRNVNGNVQLQVDGVHRCHGVQYERKLLSLEARKGRQRHLTLRSAAGKKKTGKGSKASPTESSQEGEECAREEKVAAPLERSHSEAVSSSDGRPRVNLLDILLQGRDLSKVQARTAFSSYLQRVQQRLLAESSANTIPAWPEKENDQMELVIRFLRRAASNLQQDFKVVLPNHQLPLQDRQRILSHHLGEFIHCYNKETEQMVKKQENGKEEWCINPAVFQGYITAASENDLEEVLTFYTQKNKSANVFLGTKVRSVEKEVCEVHASGDSGISENSKTVPVAKEDSSASESSLSTGKVSSDPDTKATERQPSVCALSEEQQTAVGTSRAQPDVQASKHSSSFPATLDSTHVHLQHGSPAAASLQPTLQPPSYAQCLAKSQFCHPEALSDPPAYTTSPMVTQPPRVIWADISSGYNTVSTGQPTQGLRRIQSFTSTTASNGAASSIPSATHIYSQRLSRPTSAGQVNRRSSSTKMKSRSAGFVKELNSLSAQSNQESLISALQKLADKQVARHYASSSHINLLTQHLTKLNLANGMLNRDCFTLNPKVRHAVAPSQGPVRAGHSRTLSSTCPRPMREDEGLWDDRMPQNTHRMVTGVKPQQRYHPTQDSYQLQFALQQLQQQQKLHSRHFLDQSHCRNQAPFPDRQSASHNQVPTSSSSCPPFGLPDWPNHSHSSHGQVQSYVNPALAPKPPSSGREGQIRKTATKRLMKQMSSESSASGAVTSGQHMVYEAICGKTGLSVYRRLFQGPEPSHR